MNDLPTTSKWAGSAVLVLSVLTAFMTAYRAFAAPDEEQDKRIASLATVVCLENEQRARTCQRLGLMK
ncbi:hypothetical protein [Sandarakinorhabdus sp.]|uniref:hypothetical protein n=1 Tax=Sandarakinorhabdus sp. TaxID=1916663 RepID=UPI00286E2E3A|nr:hypothetical protein [Sandarakinorhabdus sp.]